MNPDNDTIRRMVNQVDIDIGTLRILADQATDAERIDLLLTIDAAKLYRFRLKDLGHGAWLDEPKGEKP